MNFSKKEDIDWLEIGNAFCKLERYGNLTIEQFNICKGIIYGISNNITNIKAPVRFLNAYKNLKKDKTLHIIRADKSNTLVIMNRCDYDNKMLELLNDQETYIKLRNNPLEKDNANFNKNIKGILKDYRELIPGFTTICPSLPYLYGTIKTHKPSHPTRPIISSVGSRTYKLSKWLVKELSPLLGTISGCSVKNNEEFLGRIRGYDSNDDFKLISFDVKSLFTNVPVDDLLEFLEEEIDKHTFSVDTTCMMKLIKLCVKECRFIFNNEYY